MIAIQKGAEPEGLTRLRQRAIVKGLSPKSAYESLKNPLKGKVREKLLEEQGQICAYCMCRIPRSDAEVGIAPIVMEHIMPRNPEDGCNIGQGLDYNNLVAVCHGNRGRCGSRTKLDLTCDAHKGNDEFRKVNPCRQETLDSITYTLDGKINASDADVQFDLLHILNLNCPSAPLMAERKAALAGLLYELNQIPDEEQYDYCSVLLKAFCEEINPKTPYAGILIWYLKSIILALESRAS